MLRLYLSQFDGGGQAEGASREFERVALLYGLLDGRPLARTEAFETFCAHNVGDQNGDAADVFPDDFLTALTNLFSTIGGRKIQNNKIEDLVTRLLEAYRAAPRVARMTEADLRRALRDERGRNMPRDGEIGSGKQDTSQLVAELRAAEHDEAEFGALVDAVMGLKADEQKQVAMALAGLSKNQVSTAEKRRKAIASWRIRRIRSENERKRHLDVIDRM